MVKEIKKSKNNYYVCEECSFAYKEKQLAEKCEEWCKKHHSCNIEITKNSIKI
jgi:hypothetical protein